MNVPGPGRVTISKIGGHDAADIDALDVSCSWTVSAVGTLSTFVTWDELARRGLPESLLGRWIRCEWPTAGAWFGRVTDERGTEDALELSCQSGLSLLRKRRTLRRQNVQHGPPAALAAAAVRDAMRDDPTWIVDAKGDEAGLPIAYEWRAADVLDDVLPSLPCEYTVDEDRRFWAAPRLGRDRPEVVLIEGHQVAGWNYARSLWTVENDIVGIVGDHDDVARTIHVEDADSIRVYGRLQGAREYNAMTNPGGLYGYVHDEIERVKAPSWPVSVTIHDVGDVFGMFREGDAVRLIIETARIDQRFRITARALDGDDGTMTLTGSLSDWIPGGEL